MEEKRKPRRRLNIVAKTARTRRIFARLREGWAYDDIAQAEGLSAERIRQIVTQVLDRRFVDTRTNHAHVQNERLRPALKLVCEAVGKGDLKAVGPLIKIVDRLDKHRTVYGETPESQIDYRQKLLDRINSIADNLEAYEEDEELKARMAAHADSGRGGDEPHQAAAGPADYFFDPAAARK